MRKLLGVLFGTTIGLATIAGMAWANLHFFPWPDFDWRSPQGWGDALAVVRPTEYAMLAGSWSIATLLGGLVGVRAANWTTAGWMVAVLLSFAGVVAGQCVPQPFWMQVVLVLSPFIAGLVVSGAS